MEPFDLTGPLPVGTTLLEASAGTGKTWTIAALVTRYVAEGAATLDELLVVTFGRAASQELRDRVREQLVAAERALSAPDQVRDPDVLIAHLLAATPDEIAVRSARLRTALSNFDSATIATIHQFCQQVLRSLGVAGDTDGSARLVEDLDDLLVEVVDDLYLQRWSGDEPPPFPRSTAILLGRSAAADPQAVLEPSDLADDPAPGEPFNEAAAKVRFARAVRAELERRKRHLGLLGYDDLLSQLADALADADAPARHRMRERWQVALVDEFQDTDPVQWRVFERAFTGVRTMVLIGDPKQAIYAFRGGDVVTYLEAAGTATEVATLGKNYRSDPALVTQVQTLLGGAALGDDRIVVHDVETERSEGRLVGAGAPFRLRVVTREHLARRGRVGVADYRRYVFEDLARDVKRLLTGGATFAGDPLEPRQVAVLAHTNAQLQQAQAALLAVGVPAVVSGNESVFKTAAAGDWLVLLEALEQPHRIDRVRAAALTPFFGHTAADLDRGGEGLADSLAEKIRGWSDLIARRGVAAIAEAATTSGLLGRVLARVGGERLVTDLRHIGQVLHQVELDERLGPVALAGWLRTQMSEEKVEVAAERTRRLDSDAAAVQLVTVHRSKGLEYPVVYLPSLWDRNVRDPKVALFHSADPGVPEGPGAVLRRRRNVGGPASARWSDDVAKHRAEDAGESLRMLYVALTRAQSQVVAWYAPSSVNTPTAPLHRMLFGRRPGSTDVPDEWPLYEPERIPTILDVWASLGGPQWEPADLAEPDDEALPGDERPLTVRTFARSIDTNWRRTSYSALSAVVEHQAPLLSEPEEPLLSDEPDGEELGGAEPEPALPIGDRVPSPMAQLPVGATFGSLVHAVLEHADPAAPEFGGDFAAELRHHATEQLLWWPVPVEVDELVEALLVVCASPLGPLADDLTLAQIGIGDRLRELDFELPLAGGDAPGPENGSVTLGDLAPVLRRHLPNDDPVRSYVEQLADPDLAGQHLLGYLTGSIDVVLRVGIGPQQRYLTVDYKTNWLGGAEVELTAEQYRPEALAAAMAHSDYPLQALLYTVVLHRYLRWRLPDYDPERHLGGVLYLYLRGMCGPDTPRSGDAPCGVFSWQPPVSLVEAVSELLDGRIPRGTDDE